MTDVDDIVAKKNAADDRDDRDDGEPVIVCCVCRCEYTMEDGDDFRIAEWVVCRCCLHPIVVVWLCDEGHAHTEVLVPDFSSPEDCSDALLAVRQGLDLLPESGLSDERRKEFERRARELERLLLQKVN